MLHVIDSVDGYSPAVAGEQVPLTVTVEDPAGAPITGAPVQAVITSDLDGTTATLDATEDPDGTGTYRATWTPSELGWYAIAWRFDLVGQPVPVDTVEVVGMLPLSVSAVRKTRPTLGTTDPGLWSVAQIRRAIGRALARVEDLAGVGVVPHRKRAQVVAMGHYLSLDDPLITDLHSVALAGATVPIEGWSLTPSGAVWLPVAPGHGVLDVVYTHGLSGPPTQLREALPDLVLDYLTPSSLPERATSLSTEHGTYRFSLEDRWRTGMPGVDGAIADLRRQYALGSRT